MDRYTAAATSGLVPRLLAVVAGIGALSAALWLVLGNAWFSFYGWASAGLAAVLALTLLLWVEHGRRGWRRWPLVLLAVVSIAPALAQIGFWAMFFHGGPNSGGLGILREMLRPTLSWAVPATVTALMLAWALLIARAWRHDVWRHDVWRDDRGAER